MIRGTCDQARLLDLVENFTLFEERQGGLVKLRRRRTTSTSASTTPSRAWQRDPRRTQGRLGVFWHTQGSGKSFSMVFFSPEGAAQACRATGRSSIVTDRDELDDQIYKNFADAGASSSRRTGARRRAASTCKQLLREDHRYVFTLIQKFRTEPGRDDTRCSPTAPTSSSSPTRRTAASTTRFALNMRNALPNAAFIGFTGTPLIAGEEKTREVFGDYVSVYNFRAVDRRRRDGPALLREPHPRTATHQRELQRGPGRRCSKRPNWTRSRRRSWSASSPASTTSSPATTGWRRVAEDLVAHFIGRGLSAARRWSSRIDKATAVRMYDKVQKHWDDAAGRRCEPSCATATDAESATSCEAQIAFMDETDMAVVVSQAQNEIEDFDEEGPGHHAAPQADGRRRTWTTKFKDPDDPFRLVFVCAMWMTGFDVPSCSTIYLDKPMRNHTLMQTIARANRVFPDKNNGLIVDYVGVFRDLQKALAIYGSGVRRRHRRRRHARQGQGRACSRAALGHATRSPRSVADAGRRPGGRCLSRRASTSSRCATTPWIALLVTDDAEEALR